MNTQTAPQKNKHFLKMLLGVVITLSISACTTAPTPADVDTCTQAGYFRSSTIVGGYYRCVWSTSYNRWIMSRYACPAGQEFNEQKQKCE
ncbi:carbohydrate-binding module family 14 protein [Pseudomonas sp. CBZ-4]|uniref:carbohydrate-binding module family 14 protein n=1 Tax=Pseudomonas sp. CBZ-4 TaxID=1163065 RepID=UPI000518CE75|nr:carbohydrate-binding module family 14 protein [Pseudomonas sp. CBZ-4]